MKRREIVRAVYGTFLVTNAGGVLRAAAPKGASGRATIVVRVLGVRHVIQATAATRWPTSWVVRAGAAADGLHAITDVMLALFSRRYRTAAELDAAIALGLATAGMYQTLTPRVP